MRPRPVVRKHYLPSGIDAVNREHPGQDHSLTKRPGRPAEVDDAPTVLTSKHRREHQGDRPDFCK
jgi:hypothetical protein